MLSKNLNPGNLKSSTGEGKLGLLPLESKIEPTRNNLEGLRSYHCVSQPFLTVNDLPESRFLFVLSSVLLSENVAPSGILSFFIGWALEGTKQSEVGMLFLSPPW